ncbi:D-alanine--poly(phosphoribitol) ligase subunit DltA, partial [uncultured Methanobrevibacter sp.]|uniref:D-alanine--poly(phosphoribitol) ligase subunit DltA n=1 Tax=uncultured Methanobrevibacter sp. TaxID=253161 RepID=UPI0025FFBBAA
IRGVRDRVKSYVHHNGMTVGSFLNAVFAYTYSRFTCSDKVYYTFTEHGRHENYSQNALGMFVRTIPVIVNCENKSVDEYVNNVADLILDSFSNGSYPFRLLANEFNLNNNVIFEYNYDLNDVSAIEDDIIFRDYADSVTEFLCVVNDLDDGFVVTVNHLDMFTQDTAERFLRVFKEILLQFLYKEKLSDIKYISNSDIELLNKYNQTDFIFENDDILGAFNENLLKYENSVLVGYKDTHYTYGEGAFIAQKIAENLTDLNVVKQDFVSLFINRSEWFLLASLGVLSLGGIYVPIEVSYPDERIILMLKDSQSSIVIVSDETEQQMLKIISDNDLDINVFNVSAILDNDIASLNHLDYVASDKDDAACVLYTSGTTGIPKGVLITRHAVNNFVSWYVKETEFTCNDIYGMHCSYVFDIHTAALYAPIVTGGSLYIVPEDIRLDLKALNDYYVEHNCTHTYITSQVGKLFAESAMETTIKLLCFGGMKLGELNAPDSIGPFETYGPSENLAVSTSIFANKRMHYSSIGHFISNVKGYVLDNEHRRVPFGAVGELYLSGHQLTKGYLNREKENDEAFFENTFDVLEGYERIYKTGDLVRFLPDGTLGFVGRKDSQVKIRGNRVELSEVESSIRNIDYVEDVTVQTVNNEGNDELVAYIVISNDLKDTQLFDSVREYVGNHKPEYMVPSYVIKLDEIPLNVNGKVEKSALPEVDIKSLRAEYAAPTTEMEKIIVESFEKVFNQEKISVYDDFVHLGGDSLIAIRLLSNLENIHISAADILSLRTPYAIARSIGDNQLDLDIYTLESGCPLNEPQLNVYLDIVANNKMNAYKIPISMDISKKYNVSDIVDALNVMFEVHPILNMCVSDKFEVPYLVKGAKPEILVENDGDADIISEFFSEQFDLYNSLCRFLIIEKDDKFNLFAVFNHIIFDGLSDVVFKEDLLSILDGKTIDIDDSFLKVSAFYQQIKKTDDYAVAQNFYDSMLIENDDNSGELLSDVLPDGPNFKQTKLDLDNNSFKSFLKENNVSENVLFTGAFAYTLSRFVGNDKVLFNIIENGRDRFNNLNSIGMYVNTLPLFVDCKNQNVSSFIEYMSDLVYNVMRYDYYPFRLLANKYDIDSNIIFQFFPEWIGDDKGDISLDIEKYDLLSNIDDSLTDFSVNVVQKRNTYILNVTYSGNYSSEFVERFVESYKLILQDMLNVNKLSDIDFITEKDKVLLDSYNNTDYSLDYDDFLDAFNDNLANYPYKNLVSMNDNFYNYSEGAFIADKIAKQLIHYGIKSDDCVGFLTERSEYYMFSILSILSIGAVYVPLDYNFPDEHIRFMIDNTSSKVIIVSDETYERANDLTDDDVILLNISEIIKGDIGSLSHLPVDYGNLACILYTSGTTGVPKGVKITRKSILNVSQFYADTFNLTNEDVYGLFSAISFDVTNFVIDTVLFSGASLSVVPEDIRLNMDEMNKYFIRQGVTHAFITTQVGKLFMQSIDETSLDLLLVIGEKLGFVESPDDYQLIDAYGPTEAFAFMSSINNSDKIHESSVGILNYNTKAYVLDNEGRMVPIGAVGELCLAGYQIADGYLNREEETKKAFLENPFDDDKDYSVLYRTGDMVRILPDGTIGIVGRRDTQVKVRGNRLELSEVESAIRELDFITDVTVQTVKNNDNNILLAYVVSDRKDNVKESVCDYVASIKPDYMVPSFVIALDEIPLNVNGKVDKRALSEVNIDDLQVEYADPTNDLEKHVVNAFETVLNRTKIGLYDDFVRLGGDSLSAINLLNNLGDYNISVADILSLRTPKDIAENIKENTLDYDIYSLERGCPLNESQLNVYLDIVANDKFDIYLIPSIMEIGNEYDADCILNALDVMLDVHPILSTCISDDNEIPYLVKGSKPTIEFRSYVDDDYLIKFSIKPFDLYDSLCRFLVVKNDEAYSLYAVFHHIIFDALSDGVFKKDLQTILDGGIVEVDDSFLKVSAFCQQIQGTDEYKDANLFYEKMLADVDEVSGLLDSADGDGPGFIKLNLELDLTQFKSFLTKYNVSENVLFTSVFAYTLSRFAGSEMALFNVVDNGRGRFNNYYAIGMYVNTLPMIVDCKDQNVSDFMEYMSDLVYDVMKYNFYPFRLLANEYGIDSSILFQFIPEWIGNDNIDYSEFEYMQEDIESESVENLINDLSIDIIQKGKSYSVCLQYSARYSGDVMNRFAESYKSILSQIICVDKLSEINYVSDSDLELLDTINQTEHTLKYNDILDAFNENLKKNQDKALVSYYDTSYTYAEGAFIANKLANVLENLGVESQDKVAFLVERSELYMFAVLGILSAGAIFVPLDDAHPDERIEFILKDTGSKVVIVSAETYERVNSLTDDAILLNISNIIDEGVGNLSSLPINYGELACILYTSGTTGIPKGIKITKKSIINLAEYCTRNYGLTSVDVFGLFSSIGFDAAYKAIFASIYSGACLDVIPSDVRLNMSLLNDYLIKQGINYVDITTQVAKLFIGQIENIPLDVLFTGGEKLGEFEANVNCRFVDGYGPTEAYVEVACIDVCDKIDSSSVGHLVDNAKAYVLDDEFRRVPYGAVGELYLAGYQIAEG